MCVEVWPGNLLRGRCVGLRTGTIELLCVYPIIQCTCLWSPFILGVLCYRCHIYLEIFKINKMIVTSE